MNQNKVFIIAEAGSNWRCGALVRDIKMAKSLIDVAVDSGADAVKFQTYKPEIEGKKATRGIILGDGIQKGDYE